MHDWGTCIHESGHAVVGLATGVAIGPVWVRGATGKCCYAGESTALCAMAGPVAEWHLKYPDTRPAMSTLLRYVETGHADIHDALGYLDRMDGDGLVACWLKARAVVVDEWPAILRVATALQRHGRLSGDAVRALWRARRLAA